jgi:vitamin B12 transporter
MNPSRSFDLAHLSLDNVERIEILRGPQSTLYGSDALAGVVNILSRRGAGKPSMALETSGGSYGTLRSSASAMGSAGRLAYSFGLSHVLTGGLSAASDAATSRCPEAWAGRFRPQPRPGSSYGP